MLSREQKAIKVIEEINKNMEYKYDKKIGQYVCIALRHRDRKVFKTLLNLIEKQSKEIDERDKYNTTTLPFEEIKEMIEQNKNIFIFGKEYISKDKIREKIKELEKEAFKSIAISEKINVLKELLEENNNE